MGRKGAAAMKSQFWERKKEEENRTELAGTFTGTIVKYVFKSGWGFIEPDDYNALPEKAKKALKAAHAEVRANDKEVKNETWIYFRKPDVDPEMYPLHREDPYPCTFELYVDDKGLGAHSI